MVSFNRCLLDFWSALKSAAHNECYWTGAAMFGASKIPKPDTPPKRHTFRFEFFVGNSSYAFFQRGIFFRLGIPSPNRVRPPRGNFFGGLAPSTIKTASLF